MFVIRDGGIMAKIQNFLVVLVVAALTACGGGGSGGPSFPSRTAAPVAVMEAHRTPSTPPPAANLELRDLVADSVATDVARFDSGDFWSHRGRDIIPLRG